MWFRGTCRATAIIGNRNLLGGTFDGDSRAIIASGSFDAYRTAVAWFGVQNRVFTAGNGSADLGGTIFTSASWATARIRHIVLTLQLAIVLWACTRGGSGGAIGSSSCSVGDGTT